MNNDVINAAVLYRGRAAFIEMLQAEGADDAHDAARKPSKN